MPGLAPAESITCVIDDSALCASPCGPALPFRLRPDFIGIALAGIASRLETAATLTLWY